jgi:hypothetical protein
MKIKSSRSKDYYNYKETLNERANTLDDLSKQYKENGDLTGSLRLKHKALGVRLALSYLKDYEF